MNTKHKVYINHFDAICCAGSNSNEIFKNICEKKETISLDHSYVQDRTVAIGKMITNSEFNEEMIGCCQGVLANSNLKDFSNTLLIVGSSVGGMKKTEEQFFEDKSYENIDYKQHVIDAISYTLNNHFSFYDDISFSTACTSSANALGYAKEVIEKGIYKNVLVVGADALCHTTVCGFSALSVLSSKPCTPFEKEREGMNVAEAIAVLLLQDEKQINSTQLCGVGYSSDAHHMTQPHPQGLGAIKAMQNALDNAKLNHTQIDYVNAHGTGTQANDASEANAITTLFKEGVMMGSTKSYTGHTLGAAGALEAVICIESIQKGLIPPCKNLQNPEHNDMHFTNEPLSKKVRYVMSNSFAFGGNNASLIFGRCDEN
jgi:3-oxoacyl-[acyl-carrier-protein] synthase-1